MSPIKPRRIYVASSWRNPAQPQIVDTLRAAGHAVYDFRNPAPGNTGFAWSEIDPDWQDWSPGAFAEKLNTHPVAAAGFACDKRALDWCDTCILVLPCGRSAHLELGYAAGQGKDTYVLLHSNGFEPELMYLLNTACATSIEQIVDWMAQRHPPSAMRWHEENGGAFHQPAGHALRLLREVVELGVAAGANAREIIEHASAESARRSPCFGSGNGKPARVARSTGRCLRSRRWRDGRSERNPSFPLLAGNRGSREGQLCGTYLQRQPTARKCRWRCRPNSSLRTPLDDRFGASNLKPALPRLGHKPS